MRSITIRYDFDGDESEWRAAIDAFINALDADKAKPGSFTYQVAVADNGTTRIHWGRWDSAETLTHVQSQDYFKSFAAKVRGFSGGGPDNVGADVVTRTANW